MSDSGPHTIRAVISDKDGGSTELFTDIVVEEVEPELILTGAIDIAEGATYTLGLDSHDPGDDTITGWVVDWGDGTAEAFGPGPRSAEHEFVDDGEWTISVSALDEDGIYTKTTAVTVDNVAPVLSIPVAVSPIAENGFARLNAAIMDPGVRDTFVLEVHWGDSSEESFGLQAGTTECMLAHQYTDDGTYTIDLWLFDDDGGEDFAGTSVTITNAAPVISSLGSANVVVGESGLVSIAGSISDNGPLDTHVVSVEWGDGSASIATVDSTTRTFHATHRYADDAPTGTPWDDYVIEAQVWDDDGGAGSARTTVTVTNMPPIVTALRIDEANEDGWVSLAGAFIDVGIEDTHSVTIHWSDGTESGAILDEETGTFTATHQYVDDGSTSGPAGSYFIVATVTDDDGGQDTASAVVVNEGKTAVNRGEIPGADTISLTVSVGEIVDNGDGTWSWSFEGADGPDESQGVIITAAISLTASAGEIVDNGDGTWSWSFESTDGPDESQAVIITDRGGAESIIVFDLVVNNVVPQLEAGPDETLLPPAQGVFSRGITFIDPGADDWSGTASFGDASGDQVLTIDPLTRTFDLSHTYTTEGTYEISVTIRDEDDGSFSDSFQVEVFLNSPPIADAGGPYSVPEGAVLQLDASQSWDAEQPPATLTYEWDLDQDGIFGETGVDAMRGDEVGIHPAFSAVGLDGPASATLALRVTDDYGETAADVTTIALTNVAPALTISGPSVVEEGSVYTLSLSSTDPGDDTISSWEINWGDGIVETVAGSPGSITHTYATGAITYTIAATAVDEDGSYGSNTLDVTVRNVGATVEVTVELRDSTGNLISDSGATTLYRPSGSGPYITFGPTDALGSSGSKTEVIQRGKHKFRLDYLGCTQTIWQDVSSNSTVIFQTHRVTVELRDSTGALIQDSGAIVKWRPGCSGSYVDFGDGILGVNGSETMEVLPVTHKFRVIYQDSVSETHDDDPFIVFYI